MYEIKESLYELTGKIKPMHNPFMSDIMNYCAWQSYSLVAFFQQSTQILQCAFKPSVRCVEHLVHCFLSFCSVAFMGQCCHSQTASSFRLGASLEICLSVKQTGQGSNWQIRHSHICLHPERDRLCNPWFQHEEIKPQTLKTSDFKISLSL